MSNKNDLIIILFIVINIVIVQPSFFADIGHNELTPDNC